MITVILILLTLTIGAYYITKILSKTPNTVEDEKPSYTPEELENIKLAEELYNKDLRPIVTEKTEPVVVEELNVVEPEFVEQEQAKPVKKKRKYYPKNKK